MSVGISEMRGVPGAAGASMCNYEGTEGPATTIHVTYLRYATPKVKAPLDA